MANKFNIPKLEKAVDFALTDALAIAARDAVNHFRKSFENEGFTDETLSKWEKRKNYSRRGKRNGGIRSVLKYRKILYLKGNLKRSVRISSFSSSKQVISSNLPYSEIHNEGGVIPERTQVINFKKTGSGFGSVQFHRKRTRRMKDDESNYFAQKANIGKVIMPKRQYIGNSRKLERFTQAKINAKINTAIMNSLK